MPIHCPVQIKCLDADTFKALDHQALTDGSFKGKKIASAWRITRTALDEFLKS